MEIWSGVHLIEGVRGCNCYLVTRPSLALIDTGIPGQSRKVVAYLANLGYDPEDLKWIILTHHDVDHVGSAAQLQRLTGAEVCMHPADVDCLLRRVPRRPRWKALLSSLYRRLELPEIDTLLEDGQNIGPLEVIHTPGHSPGSIRLLYGSVLF
ncbi:MAG: MBL fold metallo-hydrolase, partial [Dehalococcoidia bacterium]|nr:MBL fold metallo-hydrolase [Dehalococcoidia bacterium]